MIQVINVGSIKPMPRPLISTATTTCTWLSVGHQQAADTRQRIGNQQHVRPAQRC
jgi:hypothetical protein